MYSHVADSNVSNSRNKRGSQLRRPPIRQWNKPDGSDLSSMSKETPKDDPRQQTDWKNTKQTNEPWKGATEKEQLDPDRPKPDLEKWHDTSTH